MARKEDQGTAHKDTCESLGRAGSRVEQCPGLFLWPVTLPSGSTPTLSHPFAHSGQEENHGGRFLLADTWCHQGCELAPEVWTLLQGPQSLLELGRQEGCNRLAGKPH